MLRRLLMVVWAGVSAQLFGPTPLLQADLNSGLVAYYPLNGSASDACGSHDGVAYGLIQTVDRFGFELGASYFSTNSYIDIPDSVAFHLQQLSVSVWVQPEPFTGYRMVLSKDDGGRGIQFYMNGVGRVCLGYFGLGNGSWHNVQFSATFVPGQWIHLAATYDGQSIRLFTDGNPAGSLVYSATNTYGTRSVEIGRNTYSQNEYFMGALDDLRIYQRALSLSEIQDLARERPGWPFNLTAVQSSSSLSQGLVLAWQSWVGWLYAGMYSTNLAADEWTSLPGFANLAGTGQLLNSTNGLSGTTQAFFRIRAQGPTPSRLPWTGAPPLPVPKADLTMAAWNGKLYAIGGYNLTAKDPRSETYQYDPALAVWTRKTDMPTPRWGPIAVEFNAKIYVFGGQGASAGVNQNEVYDPVADSWQAKANIPSGLAAQGLMGVGYSNRIHLFYRSAHYEYDPATDTYTPRASVPTPRTWGTCAVVSNRLYLIGGYAYPGGTTNVNEVYDPATDSWATKAPLPVQKYGVTREGPVINGCIYVTHGRDVNFYASNFLYDPTADSWRQKAVAGHPRDGVGCCVLNGLLYVVGGRADSSGPYGLIDHEVYDPSADN